MRCLHHLPHLTLHYPLQLLGWYHAVDVGDKANELKTTWEMTDRNGDSLVQLSEYLTHAGFLGVREKEKESSLDCRPYVIAVI